MRSDGLGLGLVLVLDSPLVDPEELLLKVPPLKQIISLIFTHFISL